MLTGIISMGAYEGKSFLSKKYFSRISVTLSTLPLTSAFCKDSFSSEAVSAITAAPVCINYFCHILNQR